MINLYSIKGQEHKLFLPNSLPQCICHGKFFIISRLIYWLPETQSMACFLGTCTRALCLCAASLLFRCAGLSRILPWIFAQTAIMGSSPLRAGYNSDKWCFCAWSSLLYSVLNSHLPPIIKTGFFSNLYDVANIGEIAVLAIKIQPIPYEKTILTLQGTEVSLVLHAAAAYLIDGHCRSHL